MTNEVRELIARRRAVFERDIARHEDDLRTCHLPDLAEIAVAAQRARFEAEMAAWEALCDVVDYCPKCCGRGHVGTCIVSREPVRMKCGECKKYRAALSQILEAWK